MPDMEEGKASQYPPETLRSLKGHVTLSESRTCGIPLGHKGRSGDGVAGLTVFGGSWPHDTGGSRSKAQALVGTGTPRPESAPPCHLHT